jgi:hypothetical protein
MHEDTTFVCPPSAGSLPDAFAPAGQDHADRGGQDMHIVLKPSWFMSRDSSIGSDSGRAPLYFCALQKQSEPSR